ncbi:ketosteroid isomerase-like protein [Geodermatophilus bullaregiensis]|nr:ketosteroid isomerase-like protein [Geodermatophilus bullaregiensis]
MTVATHHVVETGDLALLGSEWSHSAGDVQMSGVASELAQRQAGGGWLHVIDPLRRPACRGARDAGVRGRRGPTRRAVRTP